ncbi:hypothetical protein J1605_022460 [Eschrichtius robustus]|uniref:Uncharacterized protein n=1 Tax=Eschrichtius robustus TaxID=9764 RepID=A0AB34HDA2_ESCRO|nr:hypothetical protein J1605_022460 [Eschrichtius robustus]
MRSLRAAGKSDPRSLQLEKARAQQRRPNAAKTCSAWLSSLAHTAAAERHQGEVRLGKGAADAEVAVKLRVLITFTQAPLLRLLQAPPMLPAEGPCSKPAGNSMVRREHKKETYPFSDRSFYFHPGPQLQRAAASQGECLTKFSLHVICQHVHQQRVLEAWSKDAPGCITFKAPNTGQISPDDEIYVSACLRPSETLRRKERGYKQRERIREIHRCSHSPSTSLSSSQFLHSDRRWLSSAEEASGQVGSQLQTSGISTVKKRRIKKGFGHNIF